jgi:hypothetical protein
LARGILSAYASGFLIIERGILSAYASGFLIIENGRRGVTPAVEPAYLTSEAMDGAAQANPSERRPGWPQ